MTKFYVNPRNFSDHKWLGWSFGGDGEELLMRDESEGVPHVIQSTKVTRISTHRQYGMNVEHLGVTAIEVKSSYIAGYNHVHIDFTPGNS